MTTLLSRRSWSVSASRRDSSVRRVSGLPRPVDEEVTCGSKAMGEHHSPAPFAFNRQDPRIATRKATRSPRRFLVMLHDEVRERPAGLGLVNEAKRHPGALVGMLDPHDFRAELEPLFAGE